MNATYFVEFIIILYVILRLFGISVSGLVGNMFLRCVSGCVFICFVNYFLEKMGQDFFVRMNEISLSVAAVFGISGTIFLFLFQYYLTK